MLSPRIIARRPRTALVTLAATSALAAGLTSPAGAAAAPVQIKLNNNPCYLPKTSLTRWAVAVDTVGTYWGGPGRTLRVDLPAGSHRFTIATWCGPFAGRGASGGRWIYSSGTSRVSFWAGLFT
jgi:hypothetical protein